MNNVQTMLIRDANKVIDALGGTAAVARLTGASLSSESNWRKAERLAGDYYVIMTDALAALGHTAPAALWGMKERARASAR